MNKGILVLLCCSVGVVTSFSACSSVGFGAMKGSDHGILEIRGDARGIEAYHQGINGIIESAKNSEGQAVVTNKLYQYKERQRTEQAYVNPFAQFLQMGTQPAAARSGEGS